MTNKPHILAVDDEAINLAILKEYLEEIECTASYASGGKEALDLLLANPETFDVILLDRMMPDLDGMEVLKEVVNHPILKNCPVIMQTAKASMQEIAEGMNQGAYYYLTKPYDEALLLSIINATLRDRQEYLSLQQSIDQHHRQLKGMNSAEFSFKSLSDARELASLIAQACPQADNIVMGLSEILINAVEHGNLGITYDEKTKLNDAGRWAEEVGRRLEMTQNKDKIALLRFKRTPDEICIDVIDQGKGFDWQPYMTMAPQRAMDNHGRGIAMAALLGFSKIEYHGIGNEVSLFIDTKTKLYKLTNEALSSYHSYLCTVLYCVSLF